MVLRSAALAVLVIVVAHAADFNILDLDNNTLPLLVGKNLPAFVRFDKDYAYGDKADAYKKLAATAAGAKIIIGTVGISTYGEKMNQDLAETYGYKTAGKELEYADMDKNFPTFRFFPANGGKDIEYKGEVTFDAMVNFLKTEAKVYFGLKGTVREFDKLVAEFVKASDKKAVIAKAKAAEADVTDKDASAYYIRAMEKSVEKAAWATGEHTRLTTMMGKAEVSADKKAAMQLKINRLTAFVSPNDEL